MRKRMWQGLAALVLLGSGGAWAMRHRWHRWLREVPSAAPAAQSLRSFAVPFDSTCFYPSPLGDGDIWLANAETTQAFNPAKGTFSDMASRFGTFAEGMRDLVAADPIDPDRVWIGHPRRGLLCYFKAQGRGDLAVRPEQLGGQGPTALWPDRDWIWIGTWKGLYRLRRSNGLVEAVPGALGPVNEIRMEPGIGLCFRVEDTWHAWQEGHPVKTIAPLSGLQDRARAILAQARPDPPLDSQRVVAMEEDGDAVWFMGEWGLGRIDRRTRKTSYLDLFYEPLYRGGRGRVLLVDGNRLWVRCGDRLFSVAKRPAAELLLGEAEVRAKRQAADDLQRRIYEAKDVMTLLQATSLWWEHREVALKNLSPARLEEVRWGLLYSLNGHLRQHRREILGALQLPAGRTDERPLYPGLRLYALFCGHALAGEPDEALRVYEAMAREQAGSAFYRAITPEDLQALKRASADLKRIASAEMPPDQRLWERGQAHAALERASWNRVDDGWDSEGSLSHYQQILDHHPGSPFADDAWWALHALDGWNQDGDPDLRSLKEATEARREFLRRYPDSEKAPLARFLMASEIYACISFTDGQPRQAESLTPSQRRAWLMEARQLCQAALEAMRNGAKVRPRESVWTPETLLPKLEASLARDPAATGR